METPVLQTKLYIPQPRPELVPRPNLIERLNDGLHRKLTLISAPAGFGKTTLVSNWIYETANRSSANRVAWVSLDEADNDPTRFLTYLIAALQTAQPDMGKTLFTVLQSPQPPPIEHLLTDLINQLAALPGRVILALDDYHLIDNRAVHLALTFLLGHLPPRLHLIILTRSDPPLPLARFRGRGELSELREPDLRFTLDETKAFLNQVMGLDLTPKAVATLERRTEGWAVGLQLAALALQGRADKADFIAAFAGDHRYIIDYLTDEVFEQQPRVVQTFLLQTSILERLSSALCDAVLEIEDWKLKISSEGGQSPLANIQSPSQKMLEYLAQNNLFITPLDDRRQWYRYHHLFADLLRYRLKQTYPAQVPELHRHAAAWYAAHDSIEEALHHTLATDDFNRAADLIEPITSPMIGRGEAKTVQDWIEALPETLLKERPRLCITLAWVFNLNNSGAAIEPLLQDAERALDTGRYDEATVAELRGHAAALRGYTALQQNNPPQALQHMAEAMAWLPEEDMYLRSIVSFTQGVTFKRGGIWESAAETLKQAEAYGRASGNLSIAIGSCIHLIEMLITQGKLQQAAKSCQEAIELYLPFQQENPLPNLGFVYTKLGEILYEWNDLEAAGENLEQGLALGSRIIAAWSWERDGLVYLSRLRQALGELEAAQTLVEQALNVNEHMQDLFDKIDMTFEQARLRLAQQNLAPAMRWARQYQSVSEGRHEHADMMLARVLLAHGDVDQSQKILKSVGNAAESAGRMNRQIEALVLQALAYQAASDSPQALAALAQALSLAEPEGYVRTFVDEGPPMAALLTKLLSQPDHLEDKRSLFSANYVNQLLAAFPDFEPLTHKSKIQNPRLVLSEAEGAKIIEPLNEREMEVLHLLAAGLKTPEIAAELVLAPSTIKWYLRNIYSKLGVHRRSEALAQAKTLDLLK